jgi:hypothetical protein
MARPKLELDANLIEKLASVGCTNESIAIQVGCSVDTLDRRYADVIRKGKEEKKEFETCDKCGSKIEVEKDKEWLDQN